MKSPKFTGVTHMRTVRYGRCKVLALSERTEHLDAIKAELDNQLRAPFVLHGRMFKGMTEWHQYSAAARSVLK